MLAELIHSQPELLIILSITALFIGSFLNVVIYRLPHAIINTQQTKRFDLLYPPSHCPKCQHKLSWQQNIPIISYIINRAKCAYCQKTIAKQYILVELSSLIILIVCLTTYNQPAQIAFAYIYCCYALALTIIDIKHKLLPDSLTLSLLWLGLLLNSLNLITYAEIHDAVLGASSGYLLFFTINYIYKLIRNKDGMGGGDSKLLAALGACFGWQALLGIVLISSISATLVLIISRLGGKKIQQIAYGPFLLLAGLIILLSDNSWLLSIN